MKSQR
jgi:hypothetical protein